MLAPAASSMAAASQTGVMESGAIDPTQPLVLSQTQPEIDPSIHARLVSLLPKDVPSCDMRGESFVIGRDPEVCTVVVKDKRVSKTHVRIYRDKFAYYVEALGTAPTWHQGQLLKKSTVRTLSSGDSISLLFNNTNAGTCGDTERVADFLFQVMSRKVSQEQEAGVESRYQLLQELGSGNFSKVLLGVDKNNARHKVAIKKINVEVFEKFRKKRGTKLTLKSELEVLRGLQHKNIVQLLDVFEKAGELCLVMELCEGGDLLHNILEFGAFLEATGRRVFRELLGAVKHLHDRQIVHRDLKPENVLLTSSCRETMTAKITDFGLAVQLRGALESGEAPAVAARAQAAQSMQSLRARATMCRTFCGTPHYFAPEVILARQAEGTTGFSYGKEVDMWSMGVILYIVLSAVPPFDDDSGNMETLYQRICGGDWAFDVEEFDTVSDASKDLVRNLMNVTAQKRLTAEQALQHKWFTMLLFQKRPSQQSAQTQLQDAGGRPAKCAKVGASDSNGGRESESKENLHMNLSRN